MSAQRRAHTLPRSPQRSAPSARSTILLRACCTTARIPKTRRVSPPAIAGTRASASFPSKRMAIAINAPPGSTSMSTARMRPYTVAGWVATSSPSGACSGSIPDFSPQRASPARFCGAANSSCCSGMRPSFFATGAKLRRCSGHAPRRSSASRWSGVGYPLWSLNPYPGYSQSSCAINRSRNTLATMLAAPMVMLFASPLMMGCCGIAIPSRLRADLRLQRVPLLRRQQLGVVDALDPGPRPEDHRRRDHRSRQGRHSDLVAAAHQDDPLLPERQLERAEARQSAPLGLRLVVPLLDLLRHRPRAGARILLQRAESAAGQVALFLDIETVQIRNQGPAEVFQAHAGSVEPPGRNVQGIRSDSC